MILHHPVAHSLSDRVRGFAGFDVVGVAYLGGRNRAARRIGTLGRDCYSPFRHGRTIDRFVCRDSIVTWTPGCLLTFESKALGCAAKSAHIYAGQRACRGSP